VLKPNRKPRESDQNSRKPTETQGPWPDLTGFCIKAPTVLVLAAPTTPLTALLVEIVFLAAKLQHPRLLRGALV
jgi:hypothetical protein